MFNKATLIGNLGNDPEVRYTPSGQQYCKFSLATTKKYTSNGEAVEKTAWHNIIAWGKLAEICGQYLQKGKQVFIEGEIQYETWEKEGVKHYRTTINAATMKMLGRKNASESQDNYSGPPAEAGREDDFPF
jgi:single-strand DNA-binding protein